MAEDPLGKEGRNGAVPVGWRKTRGRGIPAHRQHLPMHVEQACIGLCMPRIARTARLSRWFAGLRS